MFINLPPNEIFICKLLILYTKLRKKTVRFEKEGHHYLFRFLPQDTDTIINRIMDMAESPKYSIDWLDAATISYQVYQHGLQPDNETYKQP